MNTEMFREMENNPNVLYIKAQLNLRCIYVTALYLNIFQFNYNNFIYTNN